VEALVELAKAGRGEVDDLDGGRLGSGDGRQCRLLDEMPPIDPRRGSALWIDWY
jgi:hypothetical protein